jgi:cation:H+ antiporter
MAIGNVVGSNIFNSLIILGITALISPMLITKSNLKRDIPMNIIVTALLIVLGLNATIFGKGEDVLSRLDGLILLAIFAWYMYGSFKNDQAEESNEEEVKQRSIGISLLMIAGGLAGLVFGGNLFVDSATALAKLFGVSDKFIAITILAGGTSMPELATCAVAAYKGKGQLALGNILGSNIGNILLILGGASLITPLSMASMTFIDLGLVFVSTLFIMATAYMFEKKTLDRFEGAILLLMEAGYMWYLISNL